MDECKCNGDSAFGMLREGLRLWLRGVGDKRGALTADLLLSRADGTRLPVRDYSREFAAQRKAAGLKAIPLGKLRHSNISRMRAAGVAADVVAAWHGHTERMAVYGRITDDRLTAASAVFEPRALGQS
jgi:integrase